MISFLILALFSSINEYNLFLLAGKNFIISPGTIEKKACERERRRENEKSRRENFSFTYEHREDLFAFNDDILLKTVAKFAYLA